MREARLESAVWKFVQSRIEDRVSEEEETALICGLLAPILEEPRDDQSMGRLMALYRLELAQPIIQEAYRCVDPVPDLKLDLARYCGMKMEYDS